MFLNCNLENHTPACYEVGMSHQIFPRFFSVLAVAVLLSACGETVSSEAKYPTGSDRKGTDTNDIYSEQKGIFGEDGLSILGGKAKDDTGSTGLSVNSFLWRAALDTVSFMPLASADPFGGTILTDWYSPSATPNERFKVNVFILDRQLRSDGIRVRAFKQILKNGAWMDADLSAETARTLEDTILTRARQLRIAQLGQ
jgi:hypothetical protein